MGNLRTAWISHRLAQHWNLEWHLRFEDIDSARVVPGAMDKQLADLASLGLRPAQVSVQSRRRDRHLELFQRARRGDLLYPCTCSRTEVREDLASLASAPHGGEPLYGGRCRHAPPKLGEASVDSVAWRFRDVADPSGAQDFIVARTRPDIAEETFVPAYHWACAIDDFDEGHRALVRAADLSTALPRQRRIIDLLGAFEGARPWPAAFHCALVTHDDGHRLEKRSRGVTLAELEDRGLGASLLIDIFERSFSLPAGNFEPSSIAGETRTQLSLRDLGIAV